jgi:SAM-dependent methyltransferase
VASAIPEGAGSIDAVIANFAFEHFPDAIASLREIERVTRDGGRVWISLPNAGSFEDQLYRNLFSGGGHLQRPALERFLRQVYACTSLKLISYQELPAGFTYLGESEALRHLTWAIVDALRRSVGIDARSRSGYIFVLQKFESAGTGFREHLRCCFQCGTPDETALHSTSSSSGTEDWICVRCGSRNHTPSGLHMVNLDEVERALSVQWERYPETRPEKLREMFEERTRWAHQLDEEVGKQREVISRLQTENSGLQAEFDARGRWAKELDQEIQNQREVIARLQAESEMLRKALRSLEGHWNSRRSLLKRLFQRLLG